MKEIFKIEYKYSFMNDWGLHKKYKKRTDMEKAFNTLATKALKWGKLFQGNSFIGLTPPEYRMVILTKELETIISRRYKENQCSRKKN